MEGCSFAPVIQCVLFVYLLARSHYMNRHHDQQTKTCGVEIIGVLALVLVGRALFEQEGVNGLPTNKQHTAEGTICSHKNKWGRKDRANLNWKDLDWVICEIRKENNDLKYWKFNVILFTKASLLLFKKKLLWCFVSQCAVGFQWILSQQKSLLFMFLDKGQVLLHIVWWSHHKGHPLVKWLGNNIQDALGACRGDASGLLDQEGYGVTLVQQP